MQVWERIKNRAARCLEQQSRQALQTLGWGFREGGGQLTGLDEALPREDDQLPSILSLQSSVHCEAQNPSQKIKTTTEKENRAKHKGMETHEDKQGHNLNAK